MFKSLFYSYPQDRDPFWEPSDTEKLIGTCHVLLQSLGFLIDLEEKLVISDFKGSFRDHLKGHSYKKNLLNDKKGRQRAIL